MWDRPLASHWMLSERRKRSQVIEKMMATPYWTGDSIIMSMTVQIKLNIYQQLTGALVARLFPQSITKHNWCPQNAHIKRHWPLDWIMRRRFWERRFRHSPPVIAESRSRGLQQDYPPESGWGQEWFPMISPWEFIAERMCRLSSACQLSREVISIRW